MINIIKRIIKSINAVRIVDIERFLNVPETCSLPEPNGAKCISEGTMPSSSTLTQEATDEEVSFDWFHQLVSNSSREISIPARFREEIIDLLREEEIDSLKRFTHLSQEDLNELLRRPSSLSLGVKASLRAIHREVADRSAFARKRKLEEIDCDDYL